MSDRPWYLTAFRRARVASAGWNLFKSAVQTSLFWVIFLFLLPWLIITIERMLGLTPYQLPTQSWSPWLLFALMGALGLYSGATMATVGQGTPLPLDFPNRLVLVGPYRYVRNPMAISGLSQAAFVGVYLGSWLIPIYAFAGGLLWNFLVRPAEEHHLILEFGQPYLDYKAKVRCWLPSLTPYKPPAL